MDTMSIMQPTHSQSKPTAHAWKRVGPRMPWLLALLLGLSVGLLQAEAGDRAIGVAPGGPPGSVSITGEYWAVLIGIDEYAYAPNLESAVKDVQAVRAVLESRYGFHPSRIKQLLNAQATRKNIENTLYALSREAGPEDSVFIYYAGHGQYDQARNHGWWVPTNGEPRQAGTLITNATILRYIKGMQAKHVYLVADSCFSGSLFGTRALPPITDRWYAELYKDRSRWGLTSGATEPVADRGLGGHSPFAYFLLKLLRENTHPYLVPSTIHEALAPLVANNTNQVPRSEPLTQSGDEGGQFVFRLTETPSESPTPPVVDLTPYQQLQQQTEYQTELEKAWSIVQKFVTTPGFTTDQRIKALKQFERDFPTANPHRDEIRLLMQQVEAENPSETDKTPTAGYAAEHRFRDCPTCPEMIVVPAGSYEMGSPSSEQGRHQNEGPVHRVTIAQPFAVGVYEVTREEFERFVETMGYSTGHFCGTSEESHWLNPGFRQEEREPVVCVSWDDAQAYAQWLSQETGQEYRLLSEAEWEYVARAGMRTTRHWGQGKKRQCQYANGADTTLKMETEKSGFDWRRQIDSCHDGHMWNIACEFAGALKLSVSCHDGYAWTSPVGVFGANPFGLHDVLGNVSEWVQDCWHASYDGAPNDGRTWQSGDCSRHVIRGGSWMDAPIAIRSAYRDRIVGKSANNLGFRLARTLSP